MVLCPGEMNRLQPRVIAAARPAASAARAARRLNMKTHRTWNTLGLLLVAHAISGCGDDDGAKAPAKDAGEANDAASLNDAGVDGASGEAGADAATLEPGNCAPD